MTGLWTFIEREGGPVLVPVLRPKPLGPDSAKLARGRELERHILRVHETGDPIPWPEPATIPVGCPYPLFEP